VSLKFGILGLLDEQPLHGYEVKSRFEDMLGGTWEVNIGQIYSTVQRLERDGLVEAVGGRGDRGKLVYRLTDTGRASLTVKLLLGSRLANGSMGRLLASQRSVYLQRLKDLGELEERARAEGRTDVVLMLRGALLHTEADLKWLDATRDEFKHWSTTRDGRP
jgi:DNA-binding PadR family transcriptional regulator